MKPHQHMAIIITNVWVAAAILADNLPVFLVNIAFASAWLFFSTKG
jgi:hypothetical protein